MVPTVRHSCPLVPLWLRNHQCFTFFLENQYRPSGQGRNPTEDNVFKGDHVDGGNLWSGAVEWLQIVKKYPPPPNCSPPHQHIRHMKGTLQRRCLACPLLGWWWLVKLRDGCLVGEPWDFMTYSEMLFHSTPWGVLVIPYIPLFACQQKWKPRTCWTLSQPSPGNRWCCALDTTLTLTLWCSLVFNLPYMRENSSCHESSLIIAAPLCYPLQIYPLRKFYNDKMMWFSGGWLRSPYRVKMLRVAV